MVLFAITARFNQESGHKCKVKITGGINIQKISLIGYAVSLDGVDRAVQSGIAAAAGFQGHIIPNQVVCNLDMVGTSQIHIATPAKTDANGKLIENSNPYSTGIPLALASDLNTIQMGMGGIKFDIGKTIHNEIVVEMLKYDDNGGLIPMPVSTTNVAGAITHPVLVNAAGVVTGVAANDIYGETTIQSCILYFNYDFNSYF
jgi:hypothetical protein